MVSVGALAAIISVILLIIVAIADRAVEYIVRNFALSRLHRTRRAPVIHDSDTWLLNVPRSVLKYYRYPAILATVLCALFLLVSEVVVELGVGVSLRCQPQAKNDVVVTRGDSAKTYTTFELGFGAGFIQSVKFLDGDLTFVTAGMPKKMSPALCLPCLDDGKDDVLRSCFIKHVRSYASGELRVGVSTTDEAFGTISLGFEETVGDKFHGKGDLTGNGQHFSIFSSVISDASNKELSMFEYGQQDHIKHLLERARSENGRPVWERTTGPVRVTEISCQVNELSVEQFRLAVMTYRTVQLENPAFLATFDDAEKQFSAITEDDVCRAVLGMKIMEDTEDTGKYYEYTTCGQYDWRLLAPLLVTLCVIVILGLVSIHLASGINSRHIPHNSRSWFHHAARLSSEQTRTLEPERSGYFDSIYEEMMLVPDIYGSNAPKVVFRSRVPRSDGGTINKGSGFGNMSTQELFELQEPT